MKLKRTLVNMVMLIEMMINQTNIFSPPFMSLSNVIPNEVLLKTAAEIEKAPAR
jgi:hypothetical protein